MHEMKKVIKIIIVLALISATIMLFLKNSGGTDVKTTTANIQPLLITITATSTGTVKAETEASISAQRMGRVNRLLFDEGFVVDKNSVIAELDSENAYLDLKLAEATLQRTKARLAEINASFNALKADIEANINKAEAILIETEKRLKRAKELIKHGYITEVELDATEKEYAVARAAYESALSGRKQVEARLYETKAQEAAVNEAEQSFLIAKLNYDYSFIRSPISGVVTSRAIKLGDTVAKGTVLGSVVATDSLYVEGLIDEADIAKVSVGKEANITMDAYYGRIFKGEVYRVSPVVTGGKQETRTFEVRIRFKELPPAIKPGMSAEIEIIVDKVDNALVVPSQAVFERDGNSFLYIVKDSKARLIKVDARRSNWTYTEIISGIKEGDEVIINPEAPKLRDGARVKRINGHTR